MPLTHWGRDKMAAIFQMTFSSAFSSMKMLEFRLRFHWSLFLRVQLTIIQHWFRYWLGASQATSHYLNQWWLVYWRIYASPGLNELMGDIFDGQKEVNVRISIFSDLRQHRTTSTSVYHLNITFHNVKQYLICMILIWIITGPVV